VRKRQRPQVKRLYCFGDKNPCRAAKPVLTGPLATIRDRAGVAESVYAAVSKAAGPRPCGFESHLRHMRETQQSHARVAGDRAPALVCEPGLYGSYAYVLGIYLGDGCISRTGRTERLRITLDAAYPGVIEECRRAVGDLMPGHAVSIVNRRDQAVDVSCYSIFWPQLLPQHGPGRKHERRIELAEWQERIVRAEPRLFLRGLFHADGCYFLNRVTSSAGRMYSYDRYFFTTESAEIKELFRWACGLIEVETRVAGRRNVSVARRSSVAILNTFLGPKR
jgi:hypothetical protein